MAVCTALLLTYLHNGERYMSDKSKEISTEVANSILIEAKAKRKENRQLLLISTISVLVFLGIWELAVRIGWIDSKYLCAPTTVAVSYTHLDVYKRQGFAGIMRQAISRSDKRKCKKLEPKAQRRKGDATHAARTAEEINAYPKNLHLGYRRLDALLVQ